MESSKKFDVHKPLNEVNNLHKVNIRSLDTVYIKNKCLLKKRNYH